MSGGAAGAGDPMGRVTVVVPTRNRPQLLADCLGTVAASLREGDELVVAASGEVDSSLDALVAKCGGRLVRTRPGASHQRNAGASHARSEISTFVGGDVADQAQR